MRDTIRALIRTPIYSVVAILTLALGIGASTAAYTVFNGILLAPLAYDQPDRLVTVRSASIHDTTTGLMSFPDFEDYRRSQNVLTGMAFMTGGSTTLHRAEGNANVWYALVSDDFFPVLRARPELGRMLTPEDNQPGAPRVTVLTHQMWVVANLGLVRATSRAREIAVRTALGASRGRVIRALLKESAVLAVAAGILGVVIAYAGVKALASTSIAQNYLPRLDEVHLDPGALAAALAATVIAAVLAALAPIAITRSDLLPVLKSGGRGASADRRSVRLRSGIVIAQVALSVVLVTGAGLLIKSFALLRGVNPGYDPSHLVTFDFNVPEKDAGDPASRLALLDRLADAIRVPGVRSVVFANHIPLDGGGTSTQVGPDGRDYTADSAGAVYEIVSPGYFEAMGIPVLRGRAFTDADLRATPVPAIISAAAARHYWPNADPIGHVMTVTNAVHYRNPDFGKPFQVTVVGVVGEVKKFSLDEKVQQTVYVPITHPVPGYLFAIARTTAPPRSLVSTIRRRISGVDPYLVPVDGISDEMTRIDGGLAGPMFQVFVLGLFSIVALILAALGLYGVIAYSVTQRTSEMGIRMALGARAADMVSLVARNAGVLITAGLILGAGGAFVLGHAMRSLLYGVGPYDPATLLIVAGVLAAVGAIASYLPARRAARVDPVIALRAE